MTRRVAIFGKRLNKEDINNFQLLIDLLVHYAIEPVFFAPYLQSIKEFIVLPENYKTFSKHTDITSSIDILLSIGGDGTLLDTLPYIQCSTIPVLGLNFGTLGFLSGATNTEIATTIQALIHGDYRLEKRTLLKIENGKEQFEHYNYALNECTIAKSHPMGLLSINVSVDNRLLTTYHADGLIIATPTGSTAYNMSCGGPIITPDSCNFIITPMASHNLTIRPIVIPDTCKVEVNVEGRIPHYILSADSRITNFHQPHSFSFEKAAFALNLVQLHNQDFFNTIRNKLNWGAENRNSC